MPLRRLVSAAKVLERDDLGQVEERPGNGGDGDSIDLGAVVGMDVNGRMNRQLRTRTPATADNGYVYRRPVSGPEIPERGGIAMASRAPSPQASTAAIQ